MKTKLSYITRLGALTILRKLDKHGIKYTEHYGYILADIAPERAWNCGLI